jgi:hypothetical protein
MKLFKVVLRHKHRFYSANSYPALKKLKSRLVYAIGKTTVPKIKNSKLFAFETLKAAQVFAGKYKDYCIFECIGVNPTELNTMPTGDCEDVGLMIDFWNKEEYGRRITPMGTMVCDSITLTKKIQ